MLRGPARDDEAVRAGLLREARLLGALHHDTVVEIVDAGEATTMDPYVVTEMLEGRTLDGLLASRGALPVSQAVQIAMALGTALGAVHAAHGALTPASVLLPAPVEDWSRSGRTVKAPPAKLLDFGLTPNPLALIEGRLGTMAYAAPDRLAGGEVDPQTDVFALGAIVFESLTGELPRIIEGDAPSPSDLRGEIPRPLGDVVRRALSQRGRRFTKVSAMVAALRDAPLRPTSTGSDAPPEQRRRVPRGPCVSPVCIVTQEGRTIDGRGEDISEGGLLVICVTPPGDREPVEVRFTLPSTGRLVTLDATTRWMRSTRQGTGAVGIELHQPCPEIIADIRQHVPATAD